MQTHFTILDWLVLTLYFAGTMSIGFYFWRRNRTTEDYTAAGRSLPGWVCGLSIFATFLSSISFLALPGKSFATNWNAFAFSLSLPVATWIAVRWFMPYYRASGEVSAYALLEKRFGAWARAYASFFYLLTQIARMGTVMYLMALPLNILLGWDIRLIILVTAVAVTVYSFAGGIVAVIWTDALQAVVLIGGALLCSLIMFFNMPEGAGQIFSIAARNHKFSPGDLGASLAAPTFWVVLMNGIVINLQNFGIDQSYVQRYIASKSDHEARKSIWLGGLLYVPVSAVFLFIGVQLFAFYQTHPADEAELKRAVATQQLAIAGVNQSAPDYELKIGETAAGLDAAKLGDKAFPYFIGKRLPAGLTGLLIAAIFAAGMSTISTALNSSATLLVRDWHQRYFRPHATEGESMRALHIATVVWGVLGAGMALAMIEVKSALDAWWALSGIFSGGMLGLFLLGFVSRRAGNPAAIISVLLGVVVIIWMTLSQKGGALPGVLRLHIHAFLIPVFGTLAILLAGLLLSRIFPKRGHANESV